MLKGRTRTTTPSKHLDTPSTPIKQMDTPPTPSLKERSPDKRLLKNSVLRSSMKLNHWSKDMKEVCLVTTQDGVYNFRIAGGSDKGEFPIISDVLPPDTRGVEYKGDGELVTQDVLLEVQGQAVSGYTQSDVVSWINQCTRGSNPVNLKTVPQGSINSDIRVYLNTRFPKGGVDHHLQNTIRDNLYARTVPVTTRTPRPEERNGVDYTFLSREEFGALEKSGDLLESGEYDGNHYGTPRPTGDSSLRPEVAPGQHPSSEGKRRRNRSNVEAMAAKHMEAEQENNGGSPDSGATDQTSLPKQQGNSNDAGDGLGPLPHNWERACTDKGEQYFIDHNTGTSHWLDPRLSRVQKRRPEDCEDNELPFGWERIDDPHYGIYYIDHVNRRTQYENPVLAAKAANHSADGIVLRSPPSPPPAPSTYPRPSKPENDRPFFTRDPGLLRGERLQAKLVKSTRGLGFTIVGGDDSEEEFLQIKSVVPNGPAWLDGRLKTGDVLVFVNGQCVLGFTHHDMVSMFQNINPSEVVKLDVCRGYPLPFDPDDPNTEIVTTVAVNSPDQGDWNHLDKQRTEHDGTASMPDMWRSQSGLEERMRPGSADLLLEPSMNGLDISGGADDPRFGNQDHVTIPIVKGGMGFGFTIADSVFGQKVKKILDRPRCKNLNEGDILVEINNINVQNMNHTNVVQVLKDCPRGQEAAITIQRGNSLNLTKNKFKKKEENGGMRPKSGFLFRSKTPTAELFATQEKEIVPMRPKTPIVDTRNMAQKNWNGELNQNLSPFSRNDFSRASLGVGGRTEQHGSFDMLSEQLSMVGLKGHPAPRSHSPGRELDQPQYQYNYNYQHQNGFLPNGYDSGYGYSGYNGDYPAAPQVQGYSPNGNGYRAGSLPRGRKDSSSFEQSDQLSNNMRWSGRRDGELEMVVVLLRHDSGFGFRIVGGTEEGSQVSIGHIVSGGAAHMDGRLFSGDEIVAVDGHSVLGASHHVVVEMMGSAAQRGQVQLTIRRRQEGYREGYPYDVTVSRLENEGFGFVIISSVSRAGSTIGRIIPGSPAERCGRLQVGDRILAVNHVDINTLHHEKIINIIKESGYSVTLTVGPPLDDTSSTASTSHREDQEVGAHLGDEDQYFAVELGRGNRGFGFSIRGGREFHSMPLFVLRMAVDGPATADGRLRVGDQLIEINGQSTRNMTHGEAIETIKNGGTAVRLLVKRGKAPPPAILDQTSLSPTSPTPLPHTRPVSSLSQPTNGNGIPPNHEGQGNGNGPVSHSSPRYPPHTYFQQPYWGYHQQSVE